MTILLDFLVLQLRGALQEPWLENMVKLRQSVVVGRVLFNELRGMLPELICECHPVQKFTRNSAPRQLKTEAGRVS